MLVSVALCALVLLRSRIGGRRRLVHAVESGLQRAIAAAPFYLRLMLLLGAYAGLRVAEIGRLHADDVHLNRGVLVVRGGKGSKDRIVPLAPELAEALAYVPRLGLPNIGVHGLRHSAATWMIARGVSPKVVTQRLGHAHVSVTLQLYAHVLPAHDQQAADAFAAALDGSCRHSERWRRHRPPKIGQYALRGRRLS